MSSSSSTGTSIVVNQTKQGRRRRLILGSLVLLLVNLIWALSSLLSTHIYHNQHYSKPLFTTFLKTVCFSVFLIKLCFYNRRTSCGGGPYPESDNNGTIIVGGGEIRRATNRNGYHLVNSVVEEEQQDNSTEEEDFEEEEDELLLLSPPAFIPVDNDGLSISSGELPSEDKHNNDESQAKREEEGDVGRKKKKVQFSRVAEVRSLPPQNSALATLSRMSYSASLDYNNKLNQLQTAKLALHFCGIWFMANYLYSLSLSESPAHTSLVNLFSSTSSIFTLVLSALFPSDVLRDRFTLSKLICCLVSMSGVWVVMKSQQLGSSKGSDESAVGLQELYALCSAGFYAGYLVMIRKSVQKESKLDFVLFFGFVGMWCLLFLWPFLLIFHLTGLERVELPQDREAVYSILVNVTVGTLLSEVLWLYASFLTSPLISTLSLALTTPITMLLEALITNTGSYPPSFYLGAIPILTSFVLMTLLEYYFCDKDPLTEFLNVIVRRCKVRGAL